MKSGTFESYCKSLYLKTTEVFELMKFVNLKEASAMP